MPLPWLLWRPWHVTWQVFGWSSNWERTGFPLQAVNLCQLWLMQHLNYSILPFCFRWSKLTYDSWNIWLIHYCGHCVYRTCDRQLRKLSPVVIPALLQELFKKSSWSWVQSSILVMTPCRISNILYTTQSMSLNKCLLLSNCLSQISPCSSRKEV